MGCRRRVPRTSSREDGAEAAQDGARPRRSRPPVRGGSEAAEDRCDDDDDEADVVGRRRGRAGRYRWNRALPAGVEKARSEWRGLGGDRSQEIHRLFGGEYSGSGCYIVVTAGREDSRGLGNPMTEPFPRRPRVLGSPRSVALAKEGVPPEWEPGCGAPRRRRPVGRERQPGATGHVTSRACCVSLGRDNGVIPPDTAYVPDVFGPLSAAVRRRLPGAGAAGRFASAPAGSRRRPSSRSALWSRPSRAGTASEPRAPPRTVALIIGASAVLQRFHRLFGGEYSGSGCYIVVTAGREDSRGLGNPMTEPFPRRPRVLGSPRSVALAKEGVPPEWEPGCGAPRRRRPVGRERQPGATGHVTSRPGYRMRRGGAPRATGRAPAAGRDRPAGMEERPPRMRRRVAGRLAQRPGSGAAPAHAEARPARYLGAADIAATPHVHRREFRYCPISPPARAAPARGARPSRRTPPRRCRARPRACGGRPKRFTSRMRFGPCLLPCGAPGAVPGRGRESRPGTRPGGRAARSRGRGREGSPCECGRRRIARIVSQGFHRLFGGECSGSSGYIVVAAGREDSRGLGSPMTEFLPRRPRVLGSPRLVALAKEGVPPELGTRVRNPSTTRVRGAGVESPGPADRVVFECRSKR